MKFIYLVILDRIMPKIFDFSKTRLRYQYLNQNLLLHFNLLIEDRKRLLNNLNPEQHEILVQVFQILNEKLNKKINQIPYEIPIKSKL